MQLYRIHLLIGFMSNIDLSTKLVSNHGSLKAVGFEISRIQNFFILQHSDNFANDQSWNFRVDAESGPSSIMLGTCGEFPTSSTTLISLQLNMQVDLLWPLQWRRLTASTVSTLAEFMTHCETAWAPVGRKLKKLTAAKLHTSLHNRLVLCWCSRVAYWQTEVKSSEHAV